MGTHDIDYNLSIYAYCLEIERMKAVHAVALLALSIYIAFKAASNKGLLIEGKHFIHLVFVSWALMIIYLCFFVYFCYATYSTEGSELMKKHSHDVVSTTMSRFSLFMTLMAERTDMGTAGFVISCLIHIQMIGLLFFLSCLAYKSKHIIERKDID
jgi:hypothetical protein